METTKTLFPNTEKKTNQEGTDIQPEGVIKIEGIEFQYKIEGSGTPIMVLGRTV